jgi:transposase
MVMKGMSIEAIADVLEIQSATVSNWLFRAAKQCEKVNDELMKDLNFSKVEMDELWVIIEKKLLLEQKMKLKMKEHGCG